jgi:hypothetical protein
MHVSWQKIILSFAWVLPMCLWGQVKYFVTSNGEIQFRSDAPQELIKATSKELQGAIEPAGKSFSFKVLMSSFSGFNSAMQQTHFNENYMESVKFKEALFKGKIIEDIDWNQPGKYPVRAKGMLTIHGVPQERIIKADVTILPNKSLQVESLFSVMLSDHNIPIPRIVKEKLAEEIKVGISAKLEPRNL